MATPTSRRAPAADELIEERDAPLTLEREGLPRVTRAAAIEARLKQIADARREVQGQARERGLCPGFPALRRRVQGRCAGAADRGMAGVEAGQARAAD
jgi:hypothetical protein